MVPTSIPRAAAFFAVALVALAPIAGVVPAADSPPIDGSPAVRDAPAPASVPARVPATETADPNRTVTAHRGDVVTIPIRTGVTGGGRVEVTPVDGGGYAAVGPDEAVVFAESSGGHVPDPGAYRFTVQTGTMIPDVDYSAVLRLKPRNVTAIEPWIAAPNVTVDDPRDVARLRSTDRLVRSASVAVGDRLVLAVTATGIEGAIAAGENATDGFFDAFAAENSGFLAEQSEPSPERRAMELVLADPNATRVVPDAANDTYYLVVDTATLQATVEHGDLDRTDRLRDSLRYRDGVRFDVGATLARPTGTEDGRIVPQATTTVWLRPPAVRLDADRPRDRPDAPRRLVWFRPEPGQRVTGTSTLAPGRSVRVTLSVPGGENRSRTVAVGPNRSFGATFDLGNVPDGTTVTVRAAPVLESSAVVDPGAEGRDAVPGRVDDPDAAVDLHDQQTTTGEYEGEVVVANVSLSRGGFVVVRRGSPDGPLLGVSNYLPPGDHEDVIVHEPSFPDPANVTVVAVVHWDRDGDGEFDRGSDPVFRRNGTPARDRATVRAVPPGVTGGERFRCLGDDGGQYLTVENTTEGEARAAADGAPPIVASFEGDRRAVILAALEKNCPVAQTIYATGEGPDAVVYRGEYYLVSVGHASTTTTLPADTTTRTTTTTTRTSNGTSTTTPTTDPGPTDQPAPGFGSRPAIVGIVVALALLLWRRRTTR